MKIDTGNNYRSGGGAGHATATAVTADGNRINNNLLGKSASSNMVGGQSQNGISNKRSPTHQEQSSKPHSPRNNNKNANAKPQTSNSNSGGGMTFIFRYFCCSCSSEKRHQDKKKNTLELQSGTATQSKRGNRLASENNIGNTFYGYDVNGNSNSPSEKEKGERGDLNRSFYGSEMLGASSDPTTTSTQFTRSSSFHSDSPRSRRPSKQINLSDIAEASRYLEEQRDLGEDEPVSKVEHLFETVERQQSKGRRRRPKSDDEEQDNYEEENDVDEDEDDESEYDEEDDDRTDPDNSINTDSLPSGEEDEDDEEIAAVVATGVDGEVAAAIAVAIPDGEIPDSSASFVRLTPIGTMSSSGKAVVYVAETELPSIYSGLSRSTSSHGNQFSHGISSGPGSPMHQNGIAGGFSPTHNNGQSLGLSPAGVSSTAHYDPTPYVPQSQPYVPGGVFPQPSSGHRRSPGATSIYSSASSHRSDGLVPAPILIPRTTSSGSIGGYSLPNSNRSSPRNSNAVHHQQAQAQQAAMQMSAPPMPGPMYGNVPPVLAQQGLGLPMSPAPLATPVYPPGSIYSQSFNQLSGFVPPPPPVNNGYANTMYPQVQPPPMPQQHMMPFPAPHPSPAFLASEQQRIERERQEHENMERAIQESITLSTYRAQQESHASLERELERVDQEMLNKALQESMIDFRQKSRSNSFENTPPPPPPRPPMLSVSNGAPSIYANTPSSSNRSTNNPRDRREMERDNYVGEVYPGAVGNSTKIPSPVAANQSQNQNKANNVKNLVSYYNSNVQQNRNSIGRSAPIRAPSAPTVGVQNPPPKRSPTNGNNHIMPGPVQRKYPDHHQQMQSPTNRSYVGQSPQQQQGAPGPYQQQQSVKLQQIEKELKRVESDDSISSKGSLVDHSGKRHVMHQSDPRMMSMDGMNSVLSSSSSSRSGGAPAGAFRTLGGEVVMENNNSFLYSPSSRSNGEYSPNPKSPRNSSFQNNSRLYR